MDKHTVGQPSPVIQDEMPGDYISPEWLDFKITFLNPPDVSVVVQQAETAWLRAQAAQPLQHGQHAGQGGSTGAVPIAAPAAAARPALAWPPGGAGHIARLIHDSSIRPVPEVAIVSALGLLAGVCGRSWVIPKSGLNVYIVLVARSAIGKEAMHEGISMFIRGASKYCQDVNAHFDFGEFASGPALIKAVAANPCFTNVSGEFGRKLKRMKEERDGAMTTLRTQMTNLFHKSGPHAIAGGISYSDKEKNTASIVGASYSMIGESTPTTFAEALTSDMMEDGFLSRLTIIEYTGQRPPKNPNYFSELPETWARWFAGLVGHARSLASQGMFLPVQFDEDAQTTFDLFEQECDEQINSTDDESRRQMWNRGVIKALRVAALLAVADNHTVPMVSLEHAQWAIDLIRRGIELFRDRLDKGDIGDSDDSRRNKMLACMKEWIGQPLSDSYRKRKGWENMSKNSIVPRTYFSIRFHTLPAFANHRLGKDAAIDLTLSSLVRDGYIMEVKKDALAEAYSFHGVAYRILRLE